MQKPVISAKRCLVCVLLIVWVLVGGMASRSSARAAEDEAEATKAAEAFERLYGKDVERVRSTRQPDDDIALAKRLLAAARESTGTPALLTLLCEKATDLTASHADGYDTAVASAEFLASQVPAKAAECVERVATVRQKQYAAAEGDAKTAAGDALIDALLALADTHVETGDYPRAVAACRRAARIARAIKSDRLAGIESRRNRARFLLRTERDIANMKARLKRDPENTSAREKLVRLYLVNLNKPRKAAEYLEGVEDESLKKYVPAVDKGVAATPELACVEMGDWYRTLGETAPAPAKRAMYERAKAYYEWFLSLHEAEDLARTTAALALKKVETHMAALAPAKTGPKPGQWVDCLKAVRLPKCALRGKWAREGDRLMVAEESDSCLLALPFSPENNYQFRFRFKRMEGDGQIGVLLPVGQRGCGVVMDGYNGWGHGIEKVYKENEDKGFRGGKWVHPGKLSNNREYLLGIDVRHEKERAQIVVILDGYVINRWQGEISSLRRPGWRQSDPRSGKFITLHTWSAGVQFSDLEFRKLPGKAKKVKRSSRGGS